jgi:hypothetical protein
MQHHLIYIMLHLISSNRILTGLPRGVHCTKLVRTHVSAQEGY